MDERIGFGKRLLASLIDGVVIFIAGAIVGSVLGGLLGAGAGTAAALGSGEAEAAAASGAMGGILGAIAGMAIGMGILSIAWAIWEGLTGAALGKQLLKIRIKSEDGSPGSPKMLMSRAALKYSNPLLGFLSAVTGLWILGMLGWLAGLAVFVGCFFVLGDGRQALHDMIVKTAVYST